jgi:hypothetical protein
VANSWNILGKHGNWLKVSSFEVFAALSVKNTFFVVFDAAGMCKGLPTYRGSEVSSTSFIYS